MELSETQNLLQNIYWITLIAVIVSSISAVLKAGCKQFDLFGVVIIAISTGLGGGTFRDLMLGVPVYWVEDQIFFIASISSAMLIFIAVRFVNITTKHFLIADAAGLATFGILGTLVALTVDTPFLVASFMGVVTGVMGGIFRDVLCNEPPVVFSGQLYATLSWLGCLLFIGLLHINVPITISAIIAASAIFISRLLAINYGLYLPKFKFKKTNNNNL